MNYQDSIINLLLDKYEVSRHFQGTAQVNRRVVLKFNKRDYPLYDIEKVEVKEAIHHAALSLQKQGLITVEWMKYEVGNIMSRVFLNLDMLPEAYAFVQRKGKEEILSEMQHELKKLEGCISTPWIKGFCTSMMQEIEERKDFPKYLPRDEEDFHLLLAALRGIEEKGEDELLERIYSCRFLGGSKEFEKRMRSRLVTIIRNFLLEGTDVDDEELLEHIGLIKTSEDLSFFGPLVINLHGQVIDFSPFSYGASMNTEMIKHFEVAELPVDRVVTIENKAAYLEYIKNACSASSAHTLAHSSATTKEEIQENIQQKPVVATPETREGTDSRFIPFLRKLSAVPETTLESPSTLRNVGQMEQVGQVGRMGQMEQELVVYLGGFYSPVKRLFLEKIYNHLREYRAAVVPGTAGTAGVQGAPVAPVVPEATATPGIPGVTVAPGMPWIPGTPGSPGMPLTPETAGVPGTHETPETPVTFYHWGDLDLGGFQIFVHLKNLIPELQPLHMDVATLKENAKFGDTYDGKYRKRLQQLLDKEEYAVFYEVIQAMLHLGIKLEQEALTVTVTVTAHP